MRDAPQRRGCRSVDADRSGVNVGSRLTLYASERGHSSV